MLFGCKITFEGVTFRYKGDELTKYWISSGGHPYRSKMLDRTCHSFKEYKRLREIEENRKKAEAFPEKLKGYDFLNILDTWISIELGTGYYVVLYDLDPSQKPSVLWSKLPAELKTELTKDIVVVNCKGLRLVQEICDSTSRSFAVALGVKDGRIVRDNLD